MKALGGEENWGVLPADTQGSTVRRHTGIGGSRMTLDALLNNFPALDASRVKLNLSGDDMAQFVRQNGQEIHRG